MYCIFCKTSKENDFNQASGELYKEFHRMLYYNVNVRTGIFIT